MLTGGAVGHSAAESPHADGLFESVFEAAPDAMVIVRRDGEIVRLNVQAERLFGYAREELRGRPVEVLVPERFRHAHPSHRMNYAEDPRTRAMGSELDLYGLRKDGTEFPVEISLSPLPTPDGLLVCSAIRDTTDRKKAEARFRGLLEAAPDGVVIVDGAGTIQLVNAQTVKMFGYTREELLGQPVELLVPERFHARHPAHRAHYFGSPKVRAMGSGLSLFGRRKDGSELPVEISLSPLETESGMLVTAAIRDITERRYAEEARKRKEEAVDRARARAEAANRELEAFSYSVAHDLRAPLRAINGFSVAMLEDYGERLDEPAREHLSRVVAAAERMGELIDALLALARVTRTEVKMEAVDLTRMAHAVVAQLRAQEPDRDVTCVVAEGLSANGDAQLLGSVLANLLGNAWKFTRKTQPARIELGCEVRGSTTVYFVRDNGAGFDMALVSKLFAPFRRLHRDAEFEGTGIGLATVQRIVQRHGGQVWAEGTQGQGATVRFTLGGVKGGTATWEP